MLKRRIVVCLDVMNNRVVKGVNFEGLKDLGVPAEMAEHYAKRGADELVFLDISATLENRHTRFSWIKEVAEVLDIPFTVGGGIASVQDAEALLMYGADKISVNSAALQNPELIRMLSSKLGSQSVVVAVDTLKEINDYMVYSHGGKKPTGKSLEYWLKEAQELGAGEFLITAIHADGTNLGFDIDLYQKCTSWCTVPIVASGGAGCVEHFLDIFLKTSVQAALAAGIFHRNEADVFSVKKYLATHKIPVRL